MKKVFAINLFILLLAAGGAVAQTKKAPVKKASTGAAGGASAAKPSVAKGKVVYTTYCLSCHQADGGGVPNMNPPLIKTSYVLGDKTRLINILLKGLNDEIEINGATYSNPMPAHDFLKDDDIANVLSFVRSSFGNKASPVTAAEVKKLRDAAK
ncbi:MAG: cytochrome c [Williamsia sp.]|nr:cytochrome c [Williamsia sp.]